MPGKIGLAALALCLAVALAGCGGGEESTGKQVTEAAKADQGSQKPATATNDAGGEGRQGDDAAQARMRTAKKNQSPGKGHATATKKGKKAKKPVEDDPPANLSDEEVCERKPSACGLDEDTPPDYSNPDVRRAEERAEEPDEPVKCDSSDCERLRREGR